MTIALGAIAIILAYLVGSFPSAFIVARLSKGVDIRKVGSRNMGAMNTFYKVGFWWGMLVLILDAGKGALAVAIAWQLTHTGYIQLAAGFVAVLGHSFPVFLGFKGGKGGATCIGVLIYIIPWGGPILLGVFGLILLITRFPTLSYSIALLGFPVIAALMYGDHSPDYIIYSLILLIIPFVRYIPRIAEMKKGAGGGGWKHVALRRNLKDRL
jgi:acyl phosphate:glycerol-3-phosphate acyltransferase